MRRAFSRKAAIPHDRRSTSCRIIPPRAVPCNAVKKTKYRKNKFYYAATQRADQSEADYIRSATGAEWDPKPMIESYHHAFSRQIEQKIRRKIEESTNIEV